MAPHGFKSRIQKGIEKHNKKLLAEHYAKLEHLYLSAPCNAHYDGGIRIWEGNADIVIPIRGEFLDANGSVHGAVCYQAMSDAAQYAVSSMVKEAPVAAAYFSTTFTRPVAKGVLVARGRAVGVSGDNFLAEAVLTDEDGVEIGHGNGVFTLGEAAFSAELGYRLSDKPKKKGRKKASAA